MAVRLNKVIKAKVYKEPTISFFNFTGEPTISFVSCASMASSSVQEVSSRLRHSFNSGLTLPLSWRLRQLNSILLLLTERESQLCDALFSDIGKSAHESYYSEISYMKNACRFAINNLKKWAAPQKVSTPFLTYPSSARVVAEPLGVVLVIAPWNFSLVLSVEPIIGAIAAGNAVALKPSEVAPAMSAVLASLLPLYVDSSAIAVIEGGIPECTALLEQRWDKIFFTGNATVGRIVMAAAVKHLTPVVLELGGKCPVLIDSTADLDVTARRLAGGKWGSSYGQACIAPDYVLVEESIASDLVAKLKKAVVEFYGEDGKSSVDHARVVNLRHLKRLKKLLEEKSVSKTIIHGGDFNETKIQLAPTILLNPPAESSVMKEEIFGPILPIIEVKCMDDAITFVKARPKPLVVYAFSRNKKFKERAAATFQAGAISFNDLIVQFIIDGLPFGGVGESGIGCYHGKYSFDVFSHPKALMYRSFKFDLAIRYPPFSQFQKLLARCVLEYNYFGAILVWLGLKKEV